jgi:hypothetical protein
MANNNHHHHGRRRPLFVPPPLSPRRHLYRHAAASIVAPTPVSSRLPHTSGWLLHRCLSCHAGTSPAMPAPLLLRRHLSHCAAASLVVPRSRRLVVALPPFLTCRRLSCRAGWLSLCQHLSLCTAVSLFATSLIALDPLNPSKKRIGLLGGPSSINPMRWRRMKGLMRSARGPFPPATAMVVIVVIGQIGKGLQTANLSNDSTVHTLV